MIYNYHTHTKRCKHASGTPEEYILRAISNGIKYMGFSDHIPLKLSDGTESDFKIPECEGKAYCDEIKDLREKYRDKIDIKVGFEMEYYSEYFDEMLKKAISYGAEYLILGQHYLQPENIAINHTIVKTDDECALKNYASTVISAMKTGFYTYVAHPDIFNFVGDTKIYQEEMRKLCITSKELSVPLEINFLGIRENRNYPTDSFWQIAGDEQAPVTFGFDAHDVESAFDGNSLPEAQKIVEKYNLNYIGKPQLKFVRENLI